jgi:hypothetical protein
MEKKVYGGEISIISSARRKPELTGI